VRGHLALLAALPLLASGCGSADSASGKPQNGLIAAANPDGIHLLEPDGSRSRLVPNTEDAAEPIWSPKGTLLAFSAGDGVYTIGPDGKNRRLVLENASGPTWSPDGKRLAVMRDICEEADDYDECILRLDNPFDLFTVRTDGSDLQPLASDPDYDGDPTWSPDGKWIAFTRADGIYLVRPDGNEVQQLVAGEFLYVRGWSPDGSKIIFELIEDTPGKGIEIAVVDVETRKQTNLTRRPGHDLAPAWSPDGKQIVFLANSECLRTGECTAHERWEVWAMDADGTNARRLTKEGFGPPSWGPASADNTS
jgi:TolB protein